MTSILSIFAAPTHDRKWLDYARDLQPYDILILQPDIQEVSDAHVVSPESEITLRQWDWDDNRTKENPDGVYRQLRDDPEGLARWQVDKYGALVAEWEQEAKRRGIPFPAREQLVIHLTNEPDTNTLLKQINRNTVVAAKLARNLGLKVDGLNLSTGHPAHLLNGKPNWNELLEALEVLEQTGSYAVFHEYHNSLGIRHPDTNPWHILRHHWAPRGPRYKVGEFGLEEILNGVMSDHHGWQGRIPPEQMVADTDWYLGNVRDDVVAVRFYMTDHEDRKWRTFGTEPIQQQLVEVGRRHPNKQQPPTKPPVTTPGAIAFISAPAGLKLRAEPNTDSAELARAPYGTQIRIVGVSDVKGWVKVRYGEQEGYMYSQYISEKEPKTPIDNGVDAIPQPQPTLPPPPTPMPATTGILDPLVLEAIVLTESAGSGFENLRLKIRIEAHLLQGSTWGNPTLFANYFRFEANNILKAYFRRSESEPWVMYHGVQELEWQALEFAMRLDAAAALRCTSMGAGQVMGFNARRVGYQSPLAMFEAFQRGEIPQMMAVVNYCLSDAELTAAIARKDWDEIVRRYNGKGLEHIYTPRLLANYKKVGGS